MNKTELVAALEAISNVVESGDKNIITFYVDDWSITKMQNN